MRLAGAVAARANGGVLSQEENEQLQYAETLIDVSHQSQLTLLPGYRKDR
jgi:hypothetical protein